MELLCEPSDVAVTYIVFLYRVVHSAEVRTDFLFCAQSLSHHQCFYHWNKWLC